jgi:lipopolysaccharide/colanic/teichoic acid biosynthesis glycosyltransferase/glycosyltransferase involved in cell wall biosynthesis
MREPVAIVHDWLTSMRGGERVVEVLCDMYPQADLFTLTWNPKKLSPALARRSATTSPIHNLARAPFVNGHFRGLLPLFPLAIESFNLDRYGLVISSSHCVAIGAIAPPTALHVAYVHSTLRYVREDQLTYEASVPGGRVGRALFRSTAQFLRSWDTTAASRPHLLIANSTYTRDRIRRYYHRDALVIEPPIDTSRFERAAAQASGLAADAPFLLISALVPNKRVDLALRAFQGRSERLVVVGEGPERARLARLVGPNVTLLSRVSEADLDALCAGCRALLHTGLDDFGMVMAEALAAGKPVIALAQGGALDIVHDGETGLLIGASTVEAVRAALDRFAQSPAFDPAKLQAFARRFDRANFERRFAEAVEQARTERRKLTLNGSGTPPGRLASHAVVDPIAVVRSVANQSLAALATKRVLDVALAASGLVLTAPLVAALAALVVLDSSGPALFRQQRTGRDQLPFTLIKLRTFDGQGRVTRVGRVLRPAGLDELPQLWNILTGDMSLIGPRPEVPDRVERFARDLPAFRARHLMRPGITGWAQVNGLRGLRGNVSIAERLRFDIEYQRQWSLALDARILLRTLLTVVGDTIRELRG